LVATRLAKKGIEFTVSKSAKEALIEEGYDKHYGARPLKRVIQNKILNPLAEMLIGGKIADGTKVIIDHKGGAYRFDSGAKSIPPKRKAQSSKVVTR
jgi:ATP-dependent Clp protease ATP-binding subunit ClpA